MTDSLLCKEKGFEREKLMGSTIEAISRAGSTDLGALGEKFRRGFFQLFKY